MSADELHKHGRFFDAWSRVYRRTLLGSILVLIDPRRDHLGGRLAVELVEKRLYGLDEVAVHDIQGWKDLMKEAGFVADVRPGPIWRPVLGAEVIVEATR